MTYIIQYHQDVIEIDIPKLSSANKTRIRKSIEDKLESNPETFGKPLRRSLKGYRKLRVGDYRVVFRIEGKNVKILAIKHRSVVYKKNNKIKL
ncbi:MAG: type II toxin-antitoxin system RelE/ParE family toxin [Candidatus Gracilibacteria bacterium]|nr:type II toxin-antitoxin system RelE/ParE family toxin [Candidatus Gracilibacteria bacterium]